MITYASSIFVIGIVIKVSVAHGLCQHNFPYGQEEAITGVYLEPAHIIRKRAVQQPLRIKLIYDDSVYRLSDEKFNLIHNHILPEAVNYWRNTLYVRRTENVILLNRRCKNSEVFFFPNDTHPYCKDACENVTMCGEVAVPESHLNECKVCDSLGYCNTTGKGPGSGISDTDFVFYISAHETDRCHKGYTVAYAAHCQQEAALDRPIAGHANLCPSSITLKKQEIKTLLSTVKHEILHALGFSVSLYAFYRDDDGNPLTERLSNGKPPLNEQLHARQWSERVIKKFYRKNWFVGSANITKEVNMVVTPRVVREARNHFNCSDLEGAELEDQGHEGTYLTHWEKRMFENEAMTGTHTQNPIYSRITLALMEDTGWYKADYNMAQSLQWGKNLGCDFAMHSCKYWMDKKSAEGKSIHPFCNKVKQDPLRTECTDDRSSVALCNLIQHPSSLPFHFQNFDSIPHIPVSMTSHFGGSVALADFCPYIQEFTWKGQNIVIRGSHCNFPENNPDDDRNFALESYSEYSSCFDHNDQWVERTCFQMRKWKHWGSGCYEYMCADGRLHIIVSNHTYTCYHPKQVLDIEIFDGGWLHQGAIICPPCSDICKESFNCKVSVRKPREVTYYKDTLVCSASSFQSNMLFLFVTLLLSFL